MSNKWGFPSYESVLDIFCYALCSKVWKEVAVFKVTMFVVAYSICLTKLRLALLIYNAFVGLEKTSRRSVSWFRIKFDLIDRRSLNSRSANYVLGAMHKSSGQRPRSNFLGKVIKNILQPEKAFSAALFQAWAARNLQLLEISPWVQKKDCENCEAYYVN